MTYTTQLSAVAAICQMNTIFQVLAIVNIVHGDVAQW